MHGCAHLWMMLAVAVLALAAVHDLAVRTVPNALIAVLAFCGLALAGLQHRLPASLAVSLLLMTGTAALWIRGCMGGADAKLLAASGLLVAPAGAATMLLGTALAGGVLCLPYLAGRRLLSRPSGARPTGLVARVLRCERWRLRRRGPLPYAVAIAAGTGFALLQGV